MKKRKATKAKNKKDPGQVEYAHHVEMVSWREVFRGVHESKALTNG